MNSTICICCGEPMIIGGGALTRDPNVCASCSSLGDGMLEELVHAAVMKIAADQERERAAEATEADARAAREHEKVLTNRSS